MGLFRRIKKWKKSGFKSSRPFKSLFFENLEQRILLSGDNFSCLAGDSDQLLSSDNNNQIIQYSMFEDCSIIEQTDLLLSQSNSLEYNTAQLSSQGLQFNLIPADGMSQQAIDAFQQAADLFSAMFTDDIIVNINIDFKSLSTGILGSSSFTLQRYTYSQVLDALTNDQTGTNDNIAVNNLPTGSGLDVYINRTSNNPNGSGSPVPYLDNDSDANNSKICITTSNAKALGLLSADDVAVNATIIFNSQYTWDFDRSDGITAGTYDFVGCAMHEIAHALGFTSGVDFLDDSPGLPDNTYTYISTLDLYRFSDNSISAGADIDWTADTRSKFFSIDGGVTAIATFSTGVNFGDGYENSHWKDNLGFGIMDPTIAPGEFMDITNLDMIAWDVIGWDLASISVQQIPYNQTFDLGMPDSTSGWEYCSSNEGRIQVVSGRLRMDDFGENYSYSLNEAILHIDLRGKSNICLSLDHWSIADESTSLPAQFTGHYDADGISLSIDGIHWVRITSLSGSFTNQSFLLDTIIGQAKTAAESEDLSEVRIKFQQYDNTLSPNDGREFDNIKVTAASVIAVQNTPYSQNFESGLPGSSDGWEYYSSNEGRIQVVSGRLRMDDFGENYSYSLNEAILHIDLRGKSNICLSLDHWSIADESTSLPAQFTGHYDADGISLSIDGIHWVRITSLSGSFTNQSFLLDTIIGQAKTAAESEDLSEVRIKFQQYDNTLSPNDGREFDNILIN